MIRGDILKRRKSSRGDELPNPTRHTYTQKQQQQQQEQQEQHEEGKRNHKDKQCFARSASAAAWCSIRSLRRRSLLFQMGSMRSFSGGGGRSLFASNSSKNDDNPEIGRRVYRGGGGTIPRGGRGSKS